MITIPTTELIGCLSAVLPIFTTPPKDNPLAGVLIEWDRTELSFTTYDVYSGAVVSWVPGQGAEGQIDDEDAEEIEWGGDDEPWRVFVSYDDAKEIVKLFKLPAKLWRYPVRLKTNVSCTKLIVERDDMSRGERLLVVSTANNMLVKIPDIRVIAERAADAGLDGPIATSFNGWRLASLGAASTYGTLQFAWRDTNEPTGVFAGTRYRAFIYSADAQHVRPYNLLRDGAGVLTH